MGSDAPGPDQLGKTYHEQYGANDRPLPVTTHSRSVQHVGSLGHPHETREAQYDANDCSNPHDRLRSKTKARTAFHDKLTVRVGLESSSLTQRTPDRSFKVARALRLLVSAHEANVAGAPPRLKT